LDVVKGLSMEQEATPDHSREEIDRNLRALQSKLGAPIADTDISLYNAFKFH
ncbi:10645_t:CDS:1, partial [Ambispora gerdemannii]